MNRAPKKGDEVAFFNAASGGWSQRYTTDTSFVQRRTLIMAAVNANFPKSLPILDFGCGAGDLSIDAARDGYLVTGADVATAMCEEARSRMRKENIKPNVVTLNSATTKLPFANAIFGGCVASSVMEYVPDVEATLAELNRTLMPAGRLIMTVPNMRSVMRRKEGIVKALISMPYLERFLRGTRWREGAEYLRVSRNRGSISWWDRRLEQSGFQPLPHLYDDRVGNGALVLIVAEKKSAA